MKSLWYGAPGAWLRGLAAATLLLAGAAVSANDADRDRDRDNDCPHGRDITLINGRIHTMDASNRVVSTLTIHDDRFAAVGRASFAFGEHCQQVVDLGGRTVLPGLVDNHNHIVLLGIRPGYHTPIETARTFADIASTYRMRIRNAPAGAFITSIGGFNPAQFVEKRLPTLAELDAIAPSNPVYLQVAFTGPSVTNSAGRAFFTSRGIAVGADGSIAANAPTVAALNALRSVQTFDDKKRGTLDAMAYAAALGVTSNFDMGGFLIPGSPNHEDEFTFDGAASWDPYTAYDPILELHRNGQMKVRVRVFFLSMDNSLAIPILSRRVENAFREFGNDWLKTAGLGEFITNWPLFGQVVLPANYPAAVRKAAQRGWIYQQHTLSSAEDNAAITAWEQLNAQVPIAPLHWSLAHAMTITPQNVQRLKAMGAGLALHGFRYLAGTPAAAGPPYRMILDSGIKVGAGSDSAQISALNPWLMLYYMTTGKNSSGELINAGQTLTRQEAIRLYTAANGWFSKEEDKIGSIEGGKLADLVVLNDDYFRVPDESLKKLRSVLTIVGGKVVHNSGDVRMYGF
ncbi:amidohydrolase [Piscinibacter koreensis]|uniref:Amidohydrolase family protein n=1 Tax=Piscinibacter koreensis TaxID=2742824 RepID=A0A7Y6TUR3_9BURK|nr:amidohydrolase family protein [Schlegelella koreensis]NUZ04324.1 amidohydrolase family protein [Schlegelella koreensis]